MKSNEMVTRLIDSSKLICIYEFCLGTGLAFTVDRQQVVFIYKNNDYADVYAYHSEDFRNELAQAQLDLQQSGIDIEYSRFPSIDFYSRVLYPPADLNKEYLTIVKEKWLKRLINNLLFRFTYMINPNLSFYEELDNMRIIRASEYAGLELCIEKPAKCDTSNKSTTQ